MLKKYTQACRLVLVSALLMSASMAQAQSRNSQQLNADLDSLQQQMGQMQKDMKKLRRLLDNRALLELFQRMDDLTEEVRNLRGMLEQQDHDLAGLKKRQRELYLDTDRRLRELEITSSRAPAATAPVAPAAKPAASAAPAAASPQPKPARVTVAPQLPKPVAPVAEPVAPKPVAPSNPPSTTMTQERAAYQKAFDMLKEGRYKSANTAFRHFVTQYPHSSYAGNSQYWLGESNYVTRQFEQAVKEFEAVLNKYPGSNKVPDAMLKLGYTYYELHRFDDARAILDQLRKKYPKSTAARLAGKRLERMRREGH